MADNNSRQLKLGTENVRKLLISYALPSIIAMTATSLYNVVDSIFIGHGCGPLAIAGLAVTFPLMNLSAAFGAMVGVGASTVISVRLGQKDYESAQNALGTVVLLNIMIGFIFMVVSLCFLDSILTFFGASEQTLPYAREYMSVLLYGNILTHLYLGLNDTVRASGYPKRAMAATLTAVVINIVFNYIFIIVMKLGIKGAAIGTLCSQLVAFCIVVQHYRSKDAFLRFKRSVFKWRIKIVKSVLGIGLAPFLLNFCACIIVLLINNGLKNNGGDYYVGAYGIANRVLFVFIMIVNGINQGMQPIVGYNYGAGQISRSISAYKNAVIAATSVMVLCWLLCMFIPEYIVGFFTTDSSLIDISCRAIRIMVCVFPFVGFQITSTGLFMSMGMAHKSIFLSTTRQLLFLMPFLIILPKFYGTDGVWMSMPISDAVSCIVVAVMVYFQMKKFKKIDV